MQCDRSRFYNPSDLVAAVQERVARAKGKGESIDYLTFVPDGEPTLDINLGEEIEQLRSLGLPIAVITNSFFIWRKGVQHDLHKADWVSVKVDAADEATWRRIDRPHKSLAFQSILDGIASFADGFSGRLVTETMLIRDVNDSREHLAALAGVLGRLQPSTAYLSIATRPPAEDWVHLPSEFSLNRAFQAIASAVQRTEYLIGYEGDAFAFTGNVQEDLLSITSVHPMRAEAVAAFVEKARADWSIVDKLLADGLLVSSNYEGHTYYIRKLGRKPEEPTA